METLLSSKSSINIIHTAWRSISENNEPHPGHVSVLLELLKCALPEIKLAQELSDLFHGLNF
jgi:hypothetical protein